VVIASEDEEQKRTIFLKGNHSAKTFSIKVVRNRKKQQVPDVTEPEFRDRSRDLTNPAAVTNLNPVQLEATFKFHHMKSDSCFEIVRKNSSERNSFISLIN
jgi:hypothetical protein